jgi:hypothetical protein
MDMAGGQSLPMYKRVELGVVAGLIGSMVMAGAVIVLSLLGLFAVAWFRVLNALVSGSAVAAGAALMGFFWHVIFGVVWGLFFGLLLRQYSVTRGLAFAGIQLLLWGLVLASAGIPGVGVTLLTMPLADSVKLVVGLGLSYAAYGATVGYIGSKYVS